MNPLVSVIMPVYDGERWLDESIGSILAQTYRPIEWIAIDDGSADAGPAALSRWAAEAAKRGIAATLLRTARVGVARARNTGLAAAHGPIVAFLDQDDVWTPDYLERQVPYLLDRPGRFVTCDLEWRGAAQGGSRTFPPADFAAPTTFEEAWLRIGITSPGSVVARLDDVRAAGGFPDAPEFSGADDRGLWLELVARGVLPVRNPFVGLRYRVHPAQASRGAKQKRAKVAMFTAFAARSAGAPPRALVNDAVARPRLASLRMDLACDLLDTDPADAEREALAARALDPTIDASTLGRAFAVKRRRKRLSSIPVIGPIARAVASVLRRRG